MPETAAPAATPSNFHALVAHNVASAPAPAPAAPKPAAPKPPPSAPAAPKPVPVPAPGQAAAPEPEGSEGDLELLRAIEGEPAPEPEAEPEAPEAVDLLEAELHGHKGRAILEAIQAGALPAELLGALQGVAKINGEEVRVSLSEALKGYQRSSDYYRGKRELQAQRRELTERHDAVVGMLESWKTGDALLSGLRRLGKMDAFQEAARAYATEYVRDQKLKQTNPEAYEARIEARKARERAEELERQLQSKPDPRTEQHATKLAQTLQPLVYSAFERHGVKDTGFAKERFKANFALAWEEGMSESDLADAVDSAMQATKEELIDLARRHAESEPKGEPQKPNPVQVPAKPQAAPAGNRQPAKRMTPAQMNDWLRTRRASR